jgi:hypothetical protein
MHKSKNSHPHEISHHREKKKSILPPILILVGIIGAISPLIFIILTMPNFFSKVLFTTNAPVDSIAISPLGMAIGILIAQVVYGTRLSMRQKSSGLTVVEKDMAIWFLTVGMLTMVVTLPIIFIFVIYPINELISSY